MNTEDLDSFALLVVEDDEDDAFLIQEYLQDMLPDRSYTADYARDYQQALNLLLQGGYDLCLLDYRLGAHTGLELITALKEHQVRIPCILLTGQGDEETAALALKSGAKDYLRKANLTPERLLRSVLHVLELTRAEQRRQEAQEALVREKEFITAILQNSYDGIAVVSPDGSIKFYSPGMERIFGYLAQEVTSFPALGEMIQARAQDKDDASGWEQSVDPWQELVQAEQPTERIFSFVHKDTTTHWCRLQASKMPQGDRVINGQDITDYMRAQEHINFLAHHDVLTGLPNRTIFQDRLWQALAAARRSQVPGALLYVDLDKFKRINDTYGHDAGDLVLKTAAERMSGCLRQTDTVARLGGDEFGIILPQVQQETNALQVASKLIEAITQPIPANGHSYELGASIGTAMFTGSENSVQELIRRADKAMYQAKQAGGNTVQTDAELSLSSGAGV